MAREKRQSNVHRAIPPVWCQIHKSACSTGKTFLYSRKCIFFPCYMYGLLHIDPIVSMFSIVCMAIVTTFLNAVLCLGQRSREDAVWKLLRRRWFLKKASRYWVHCMKVHRVAYTKLWCLHACGGQSSVYVGRDRPLKTKPEIKPELNFINP